MTKPVDELDELRRHEAELRAVIDANQGLRLEVLEKIQELVDGHAKMWKVTAPSREAVYATKWLDAVDVLIGFAEYRQDNATIDLLVAHRKENPGRRFEAWLAFYDDSDIEYSLQPVLDENIYGAERCTSDD